MAAGFKDFTAGNILTAADVDDYLMRQTVMRFASAAARDSALSAVLTEGLFAYLIDVDTLTMYDGSAWVTLGVSGNLTTWAPVVVQFASATSSVNHATYSRCGKQVWGNFRLTIDGGSALGANVVTVTSPVASFSGGGVDDVVGQGFIWRTATGAKYRGMLVINSSSTFRFVTLHSTTNGYLGTTDFVDALVAGDVVSGTFAYEAASAS